MKHQLFVVLLSLMLFCSCKTSHLFTRSREKKIVETKTDIREEIKIIEEIKILDFVNKLVGELTMVTERITAIKLSVPDSLGNQYPTEKTTTEREYSNEKKIKYDSSSNSEKIINTEIQITDNTAESVREEIDKEDKLTTKVKTPAWVIASSVTLCVGLLFFAFLFLKKYRII